MSSAEMDRRAVRLALGLTIAGALMLIAGVASWLITAAGRVTTGMAARDVRLASLVLLALGAACGVAMGVALASAGRTRPAGQSARRLAPDDGAGLAPGVPGPAGPAGPALIPAPSLAEPRSLMNPPPPSPPPLATSPLVPSPAGPRPADRVWWRAAHSPGGGWDDTSEEWLRSLRGPVIQQPPPHSAE